MRTPWMRRMLGLMGGVLAMAGCDQTMTPVDDLLLTAVPCEEFPGPLEECDESTVGGTLNVFDYWWLGGDRHNLSLYEPAGNPSGEAPGIWLGNGVTPSACFNGIQIRRGDAERDGLADACEFALARAFAPYMQFDHGEALVKFPDGTNRHCAEGEPYWAAKLFDEFGVVNIVYMMAYYKDCGEAFIPFDAHSGDSELIRLSVVYNNATQHWELTQAYLSAHAGTRTDASVYAGPSELEYPIRDRAFPKIWVARNKHANYRSFADCENGPDFPAPNTDSCDEDLRYLQARFPVRAGRNVQVGMCVPSLFIPTSTRCEWFMRVPVPFSGWLGGSDVSSPYPTLLSTGFVYNNLHPGAIIYPMSVTMSGPSSVELVGGQPWPSPRYIAEVRGGFEAGTIYRWTDNGVVKSSTSNEYWMSPVALGTHVITVRVTRGNEVKSASKTVVVGDGGEGGSGCSPMGCLAGPGS